MPLTNSSPVLRCFLSEQAERIWSDALKAARLSTLEDFLRTFGIADIGELSPKELLMFVAARNLLPFMSLMQIPQGRDKADADAYRADLYRPTTSIPRGLEALMGSSPKPSEPEIRTIGSPTELPHCLPREWGLFQLARKEFDRRLVEHELQVQIPPNAGREGEDPEVEPHDKTPPPPVEPSSGARPEEFGSYGVILLDGSNSMGSLRDRRDIVSRGVALAFLYQQHLLGNPAVLYIFHESLSLPIGGATEDDFYNAVAATLWHPLGEGTNLQTCLKELAKVLSTQQQRADIVLISDGLAHLRDQPFGDGVHLHSFLFRMEKGDPSRSVKEDPSRWVEDDYQESRVKLEKWCIDSGGLFHQLEPDSMDKACTPLREDLLALGPWLSSVGEELTRALSSDKVRRIGQRVINIKELCQWYRRSTNGEPNTEIDKFEESIASAERALAAEDPEARAAANRGAKTAYDLRLAEQREAAELERTLDPNTPLRLSLKGGRGASRRISLREILLMLLHQLRALAGHGRSQK